MLKNGDFAVRRLHRSLCFQSYKSRHIHFWIISLCPNIAAFIKKSKFIFMTENMIHCWIVEECTCSLNFLEQKGQPINYEATLAVWLVVSYRFLFSSLHKSLLQVLKVRFCEGHAGSCIDMYEKEL